MYSFKCELIEPCIVRERQSIWFWIKRYWIRKQGDDDFVQYRHIYIFIYILSHSLGLGRNNITILWMDTTDKSSPFCRNLSKHKYLSQWNTAPERDWNQYCVFRHSSHLYKAEPCERQSILLWHRSSKWPRPVYTHYRRTCSITHTHTHTDTQKHARAHTHWYTGRNKGTHTHET